MSVGILMLTNTYNESCKKVQNFICEKCDFKCSRKWLWDRHLTTTKHLNTYASTYNYLPKSDKKCYICECGIEYSHRQSLYNHKKKCTKSIELESIPPQPTQTADQTDIIVQLIKQNQDFKDLLVEQNKNIIEAIKHNGMNINNNTINSHNKTFNLQVFLNEDCKDAMNISDFMNSIQLQLEELVSVGKLGFVEGISNIIIKNLKALDIRKRPLHCTDLKRETVYIKDNGVWIKDDEDNTKLRKVIKNVAFRNSKNTRLFKDKYPDCVRSESRLSDTYSIIIIEAMGGGSKTDPKESEDKILRRILKELTIDKSRYLS